MGVSKFFGKLGKKKKQSRALVEKQSSSLPEKAEKKEKKALTETERRQIELEKRKNPVYNEAYVPYLDPVEAEENVVRNRHYERVSLLYRLAKWGALAVFIVYAAAMLFFFRDEITIENFRYLMRNVDFGIDTAVVLENDIVYTASEDNRFIEFRDYLALYNSRELRVYDTNGKLALSEELDYTLPSAVTSGKYLLVYDNIGGGYSLYSYFTKEKAEKLDYPISHAAMSDSGVYAIATRNRDYQGVVYVYNSGFNLINSIMKNKIIGAIDITDDGDELLVCSYYTDELGRNMTEITLLPTKANESRLNFSVEDTVVYSCSYLEDNGFVLVCREGLRFYNSDGNLVGSCSYNNMSVSKFMTSGKGVTLIYSRGSDDSSCFVEQLDIEGKSLFKTEVPSGIADAKSDGEYVYLLYRDKLVRISEKGSDEIMIEPLLKPIKVICTEKDVFICTSTAAVTANFDGEKETD